MTLRTVYAVVATNSAPDRKEPSESFAGSFNNELDLETAQATLGWLDGENRAECKRLADENEASDFEGGNWAWYDYYNKRDGKAWTTYRIVQREVSAAWKELEA